MLKKVTDDPISLPHSKVHADPELRMREFLDEPTVKEYAELFRDGTVFPPVVVFFDGVKYWLADGFHRLAASARAEHAAILVTIKQGTRRDALLFAASANKDHGLRRKYGDKRRAVMALLVDEEWATWSDGAIARHTGASQGYVSKVRRDGVSDGAVIVVTRRLAPKHGGFHFVETKNQGKNQGRNYAHDWLYYLVRFTPQQFQEWKAIVNLRTERTILGEAVDVVMRTNTAKPAQP